MDRFRARLRGFGPVGLVAIVIVLVVGFFITPLGALVALIWTWISKTPWRDIGFVRPKSWWKTILLGLVLGSALKLLMKTVVMPLLGAPAINPAFHYLAGNTAAIPGILLVVIVGAGFGEEMLFRSYLFERLGKLLGQRAGAKTFIVLVTSMLFAAAHYSGQGLPGVEQAMFSGLTFGAILAVTGGVFLPMIMHAAFDITAVAIIYYDVEATFAHFFFKS